MKTSKTSEKINFEKLAAVLLSSARLLLFFTLAVAEILIIVSYPQRWFAVLPLELLILINNAVKMWLLKSFRYKIICYIADSALLLLLTAVTGSAYLTTLYILILTEFYLSADKLFYNFIAFVCSAVLYCVTYGFSSYFIAYNAVGVVTIVSECFNSLIIIGVHYLIVNFAILAFRKGADNARAYREITASNQKLMEAYEELEEVTRLKERQRIAKDIHDTAGHSITTVIMQTEAAKRLLDNDPQEAKKRIVAANLQAKHALEELRSSVHLLSDLKERVTLKEELEAIIQNSCDGTDIHIRSDIADLCLPDEVNRLLVNTLREGISNGLRHGGAPAFDFARGREGDAVKFLLSDNGRGADLHSLREGLGLRGLKERAHSLGGEAVFYSEEGEGFEIRVTLPVSRAQEETI